MIKFEKLFQLIIIGICIFGNSPTSESHLPIYLADIKGEATKAQGYFLVKENLLKTIDEIHKEKLKCLYMNGVNNISLNYCFGKGFKKIEKSFFNLFEITKMEFENTFGDRLSGLCFHDQRPCEDLSFVLKNTLRVNANVYHVMESKRVELSKNPLIDKNLLNLALDNLESNYVKFEACRNIIAKSLIDTISYLKYFIIKSRITVKEVYKNYDESDIYKNIGIFSFNAPDNPPQTIFDHLDETDEEEENEKHGAFGNQSSEIEHSTVEDEASNKDISIETESQDLEKEHKAEVSTEHLIQNAPLNFNTQLLNEINAKKLLDYYVGNSVVHKSDIDWSLLPSDIIKELNKKKLLGEKVLKRFIK